MLKSVFSLTVARVSRRCSWRAVSLCSALLLVPLATMHAADEPTKPNPPAPPAATQQTVAAPAEGVTCIEAESLRLKHAKTTGGQLSTQNMKTFKTGVWSGGEQLFWVSVQLGHSLTLTLPDLAPGTHDVTLFPTLARDYGRFRITINGATQEADLYSTDNTVRLAPPVTFRNVPVSPTEPLKIVIEPIGANPSAKIGKYGFVFGLDRIEVSAPGSGGKTNR